VSQPTIVNRDTKQNSEGEKKIGKLEGLVNGWIRKAPTGEGGQPTGTAHTLPYMQKFVLIRKFTKVH